MWQCTPDRAFSWNVLSLFTTSGMLFLEVSLIAFLLQGNEASGYESLARTFVISGAVVSADVLLKVSYCSTVLRFYDVFSLFIINNKKYATGRIR